jgi:hypothetical protein
MIIKRYILLIIGKARRKKKEMKSFQIKREEVKLSVFSGDILHIENIDYKNSIKFQVTKSTCTVKFIYNNK